MIQFALIRTVSVLVHWVKGANSINITRYTGLINIFCNIDQTQVHTIYGIAQAQRRTHLHILLTNYKLLIKDRGSCKSC